MKKIISIFSTLTLLGTATISQAATGAMCKVTIINNTPTKLILFTRHHQFSIYPNKQMSGKQACEDLYHQKNPLGGTGYKMGVGYSSDKSAVTFVVNGSAKLRCSAGSNMRCFNLVNPNRLCIPCS